MPDPIIPTTPTSTVTATPKPVITPVATTIGTTPVTTLPIGTLPIGTLPIIPLPINPIPIGPLPVLGAFPLSPSNPKVTTNAPTSSVAVTVPNTSGEVTFSLVVTDNLGVVSAPSTFTVTIQGPPVAVLRADSPTVTAGGAINLNGSASTSSGSISNFTFSLVVPT